MGQKPIRVGGVEVGVVCEGFAAIELSGELPDEPVDWKAQRATYPWASHDEDHWAWHVHAFVLRTEAGVVMVDTGLGGFPPYRPWTEHTEPRAALEAAGVDARDVRAVVHTHLHADHAGGAVIDGAARFPNAVHHVHPADWSFFGHPDRIGGYTARGPMAELERLGMLDLTEEDHEVVPGVRVVHAPGHTPGHRAAILEAGDKILVLAGDLLHLPAQVERPDAPSTHDEDPKEGCRSRIRLLSSARDGGWLVAVSHFPRPFGTVNDRGWVEGR
jgi:glyoxylase-like metal-dependent hydrolase (beta-lactamase superfamily II)